MVLDHITDDAVLVEVAPTPLCAKVLTEDHLQLVWIWIRQLLGLLGAFEHQPDLLGVLAVQAYFAAYTQIVCWCQAVPVHAHLC